MTRADELVRRLADFPCGAAVKLDDDLGPALASRPPVVFVLRGNGLETMCVGGGQGMAMIVERLN